MDATSEAFEVAAIAMAVAACIAGGVVGYIVVHMVARRFLDERWSALVAGVLVSVLSVGVLAVPALVMLARDMKRLPEKR